MPTNKNTGRPTSGKEHIGIRPGVPRFVNQNKDHGRHTAFPSQQLSGGTVPYKPIPVRITRLNKQEHELFTSIAAFPWSSASVQSLWRSRYVDNDNIVSEWAEMCEGYAHCFATGTEKGVVHIWLIGPGEGVVENVASYRENVGAKDSSSSARKASSGKLSDNASVVTSLAWAIRSTQPTQPLLLAAVTRKLLIIDVQEGKLMGCLTGHGEPITSIAVHPVFPNLFCTTSRDFTTRVYNLDFPPRQRPMNVPWPHKPRLNLLGPPHGFHGMNPEGTGPSGRCMAVLMGGRSGGHEAAVLNAAFHPTLPVLATCGLDRHIKFWSLAHLPDLEATIAAHADDIDSVVNSTIEDKPIFSTSRIHAGRVLSVNWVRPPGHPYFLLTHSAPALMRYEVKSPESQPRPAALMEEEEEEEADESVWEYYDEPGSLCLWEWLENGRFFPSEEALQEAAREAGVPALPPRTVLRGSASDYQQSSSFQVLSNVQLPPQALALHTHGAPVGVPPFVLVPRPGTRKIRLLPLHCLPPLAAARPPSVPGNGDGVVAAGLPSKPVRLVEDVDGGWDLAVDGNAPTEECARAFAFVGADKYLVTVGARGMRMWVRRR